MLTRDDLVQVLTELRSLGPEDVADHLILHWPDIVGLDDAKHVQTMASISSYTGDQLRFVTSTAILMDDSTSYDLSKRLVAAGVNDKFCWRDGFRCVDNHIGTSSAPALLPQFPGGYGAYNSLQYYILLTLIDGGADTVKVCGKSSVREVIPVDWNVLENVLVAAEELRRLGKIDWFGWHSLYGSDDDEDYAEVAMVWLDDGTEFSSPHLGQALLSALQSIPLATTLDQP
jgi:hypothetical protein